jgi:hypothetical protein
MCPVLLYSQTSLEEGWCLIWECLVYCMVSHLDWLMTPADGLLSPGVAGS